MDTPVEEQQLFQPVTCNIAASDDEITMPSALSLETIEQVTALLSLLFCGCHKCHGGTAHFYLQELL